MAIFAKVVVVLILILPSIKCESYADVELLYKNLITGKNRHMRPQIYYEDTTNVAIAFTLLHVDGIDAVRGTVSMSGYFTVVWKDENMVWLPNDYNNTQMITLFHDQIWKPPLINSNSVMEMELFGQDGTYVELHHNGTAMWYPGERMSFLCDIDTTYFPFDKHVCQLSVVSFGFPKGKVKLIPISSTVNTDHYPLNNEWELTQTSVSIINSISPEVGFHFHLKRRPAFLALTLLLPGFFIALLNVCVFLLPQESGERIGFSITLLLAVVVFLTIAQDILPSTAVPRLSSFCIILMMDFIMSGMIVLSNMISARVYYKSNDEPIPHWVQTIVHFGLFYCCLSTSKQVVDPQELTDNDFKTKMGNHRQEEYICKIMWKKVAEYWDKMSFVIYLLLFIIGCLFYFIDVAAMT